MPSSNKPAVSDEPDAFRKYSPEEIAAFVEKHRLNLEAASKIDLGEWWSVPMAVAWIIWRDCGYVGLFFETYCIGGVRGRVHEVQDVGMELARIKSLGIGLIPATAFDAALGDLDKELQSGKLEVNTDKGKPRGALYALRFDRETGDLLDRQTDERRFLNVRLRADDLQAVWPAASQLEGWNGPSHQPPDHNGDHQAACNWLRAQGERWRSGAAHRIPQRDVEKQLKEMFGMPKWRARDVWNEAAPSEWKKPGPYPRILVAPK